MKNTEYKDVFDFGSEALSMENKFKGINFPTYKNAFTIGENIRGMTNVSPLATIKFLNQTSDDLLTKYYPDANVFNDGNTTIVEDIIFKKKYKFNSYNYYFDTNRNGVYGDQGDLLAFKLLLFVSSDGNKVKECYEVVKPNDDEIILFLESDSGELSNDVLYGRMSEKIRKQFTDEKGNLKSNLFDNEIMKAVNKNTNIINQQIVEELMKKGYIEESRIKEGFFKLLKYVMIGVSAPAKALGWILKKLGDGIDLLKISDNFWDTEIEGYIFKKENLIEAFTIPSETVKRLQKFFIDKKGFDLSDLTPKFLDDLILSQLSMIEKFIGQYNNYIKKQIGEFFKPYDSNTSQIKDNLTENVALLCGIWNGLVDFVASVLKFFGGLLEAPFDIAKDFQSTLEMIDNFWDMLNMTLLKNIWEVIKEGVKQIKNYLTSKDSDEFNWVRINYAAGFTISFIGTFFIPIADIAKIGEVGKMGEILAKINSEIGKTISQTVKFVKIQTAEVYQKVSKALQDLLELFKIGGQKLRDFVNNLWKKIADWFLGNKKSIQPRYEEIPNLTAKELDWMASRNIGNLGGNILKESQIRKLRGILKNKKINLFVDGDIKSITKLFKPIDKFNSLEELVLYMKSNNKVGLFHAGTKQMVLTKNCTEIVAFHEMCHLKHFEEVGDIVYKGFNKLEKEMYVWKQIFANKGRWTAAELQDSIDYINRIRVEEYKLKPLNIK